MQPKKAAVYTRTGDEGTTGLFGGSRIPKDSPRVEAYGTIDELCAVIAIVKTTAIRQEVFDLLCQLQDYCHDINAELASDETGITLLKKRLDAEAVTFLENLIDKFDAELRPLDHFIVPATKPATAFLNLARTVCRRAERRLWALNRQQPFNQNIIVFFNRLADLLFTLMRYEGEKEGEKDGIQ